LILIPLILVLLPGGVVSQEGAGVIDIESVGYLQVQSQVDGARVYFDRQFMGFIDNHALTVPVDVMASPQYSNLIIEYSGYQTFIGPLPGPLAGKTVGVSVELNKIGYDRMGIVQFESGLPGAELLLNGKSIGFTPDSGTLMIQTVPDGLYEFTVQRPGNLTFTKQQYVTSNALTMYRVDLQPALTGDLQVTTTPEGAGIYLDNRYMGLSPLTIPDIHVGKTTLKITSEGYQDYIQDISVIGGVSNQIDAVLVSLPPTPTQSSECLELSSVTTPQTPLSTGVYQVPGNMMLYAGLVILVVFIGCVTLFAWMYRRR